MSPVLYYFLSLTGTNILMCWSLYLPYRVGQLHFLTVACMLASAYFSGYAARELSWPFALILIFGVLIGALICLIPSFTIGDAPCFTVVIVGLTVIFIFKTAVENIPALGGTIGFFGIPEVKGLLPLTYLLLAGAGVLIYKIDHSRLGRAASLVFVDKATAAATGVDIKRLGMFFQIIAGGLAGLAGTLYAFLIGSLFPEFFSLGIIGTFMCMLFVGGHTTMWGIIASIPILEGMQLFLPSSVASWRQVIYALTLIAIVLMLPGGLITKRMLINLTAKMFNRSDTGKASGTIDKCIK
ncbi:MAG: branched-chain amino acid ABC transporter permease [Firmicutes bacterium]|nr:branched-chain amino acid ABC transporter permease [Bacillota bacterium]